MSRLSGRFLGALVVAVVACVDAETAPSGPTPNTVSGGGTASVPTGTAGTGSSSAGAAPMEPETCIDFVGSYRGSLDCSDNTGGSIYATFTQEGCVLSGTNTEGAVETWSANGNTAVRYVYRAGWMGTCTLTVQGDTFSEYCDFTNQLGASANCTWSGAIIRPQGTGGSGGSAGNGGTSGGAAGASAGAGGATGGTGGGGAGGTGGSVPVCDNMCDYSLDGECDYPDLCAPGTDCTDCGM